ncbi:MAG: phosphoribosylformylglycinamidine cyclo-ligase, partial [Gammaproteobacteria bacterium]
MYQGEDYDLAGFAVGVVEKSRIIDGSQVAAGDVIIGLASSGPHSNGYSLIRKVLAMSGASFEQQLDGQPLIDLLLAPTRIYVRNLLALMKDIPLHALAHITGGGVLDNIPRVIPAGLGVTLDRQAWSRPAIFDWLQHEGAIAETEMYRTFNMGIGMVLCVAPADAERVVALLHGVGEQAWCIGEVTKDAEGVTLR